MKLTTAQLWRGVTTGIVTLVLSFSLLRPSAEICALLIRRQWPEAWFSGLIVWYFDLFAAILSIVIAIFVGRFALQSSMPIKLLCVPLRWALPIFQLSLCLLALWPMRGFLIFEVSQSIESYASAKRVGGSESVTQIAIPPMTKEQQQAADQALSRAFLRMHVPVLLNFPVILAELPYVIASPDKMEWTPRGMLIEEWRALAWPFAGIFFWWCAGRGMEALQGTRRSTVSPRLTLAETALAIVLLLVGLGTLVGLITSTPDDRRDVQFLVLIGGGLLWGLLAAITLTARVLQWRTLKRRSQSA
jgi:hypothetical protein